MQFKLEIPVLLLHAFLAHAFVFFDFKRLNLGTKWKVVKKGRYSHTCCPSELIADWYECHPRLRAFQLRLVSPGIVESKIVSPGIKRQRTLFDNARHLYPSFLFPYHSQWDLLPSCLLWTSAKTNLTYSTTMWSHGSTLRSAFKSMWIHTS